ncbi:MAG TPA: NAD-dependent epimerase/dehydratase family protein [Stellaceae bacterium]|nr:NAD-dependent epimerase/dehydratase family protein [Stellaceae bacterium]
MIYIIGGEGFVGSAFVRYCRQNGLEHQVITHGNHDEFAGRRCDVLVNANGSSRKYLADREPLNDFDRSVRSVAASLSTFRAGMYVLISSGDVYDDPSRPGTTCEEGQPDLAKVSRYGLHKYLAERLVIGTHPNWLIIRAGGFVGPGLRKNAVFDILAGAKIWLSPDSALQFIHTDHAAEIVMRLAATTHRQIVNLGGSGTVRLGELHHAIGSAASFDPQAPTVTYELSLAKLATLCPIDIPASFDEVHRFAAAWMPAGA